MAAKKKTTAAKAKVAKKTTTQKTTQRAEKKVSQKKVPFKLDSAIPAGAMGEKWDKHRFNLKLVNPANKRKYEVFWLGYDEITWEPAKNLPQFKEEMKKAREASKTTRR